MDHPGRNALGDDLIGWLEDSFDAAGAEPVLLTGTGTSFCAGLDLKQVARSDRAQLEIFLRRIDALALRIYLHPAPTVAWINGHAIAGGCVLALCCDQRIATRAERARLGLNEVALGACFPPAIRRIMAHRIPSAQLSEVMLGARLFDMAGAQARGLVDELVDDDGERARACLEALSNHPRDAYRITKLALREEAVRVTREDEARFVGPELDGWASDEIRARIAQVLGK